MFSSGDSFQVKLYKLIGYTLKNAYVVEINIDHILVLSKGNLKVYKEQIRIIFNGVCKVLLKVNTNKFRFGFE